jgi:hypothetical protein
MVILRAMTHVGLPMAAVPASPSDMSRLVSGIAMAIILTVVGVGAIMVAIAARRAATRGSGSGRHSSTRAGGVRRAGGDPTDAWTEAGRRMPVPPREERGP